MAPRRKALLLLPLAGLTGIAWCAYVFLTVPVCAGFERMPSLGIKIAARSGRLRKSTEHHSGTMFAAFVWLAQRPHSFAFKSNGTAQLESATLAKSSYWFQGSSPEPWFIEFDGVLTGTDIPEAVTVELVVDGSPVRYTLDILPEMSLRSISGLPRQLYWYTNRWWRVGIWTLGRALKEEYVTALPGIVAWRQASRQPVTISAMANFVSMLSDGDGLVIATEPASAGALRLE